MKNCRNCADAIFDPVWGEYKCGEGKYQTRVSPDENINCRYHKPGKPTESKQKYGADKDE